MTTQYADISVLSVHQKDLKRYISLSLPIHLFFLQTNCSRIVFLLHLLLLLLLLLLFFYVYMVAVTLMYLSWR